MPVLLREINFSDVRDNWPPDAMLFCSGFLWRRPSLKIGSVLCSHWHKSPSGVLMCAWYKSILKIGQQTKARCFLPEVSKVTFYQTQWSQEWILSFLIREMSIPIKCTRFICRPTGNDGERTVETVQFNWQILRDQFCSRLFHVNLIEKPSQEVVWATNGIWTVLLKILGMPPYLSLVADQKKK